MLQDEELNTRKKSYQKNFRKKFKEFQEINK